MLYAMLHDFRLIIKQIVLHDIIKYAKLWISELTIEFNLYLYNVEKDRISGASGQLCQELRQSYIQTEIYYYL